MYRLLHDNLELASFAPLREAAYRRVTDLIAARRPGAAWRHLAGMVESGYAGADEACRALGPTMASLDADTRDALSPAWSALLLLAAAQRDPGDATRQAALDARTALAGTRPPAR